MISVIMMMVVRVRVIVAMVHVIPSTMTRVSLLVQVYKLNQIVPNHLTSETTYNNSQRKRINLDLLKIVCFWRGKTVNRGKCMIIFYIFGYIYIYIDP